MTFWKIIFIGRYQNLTNLWSFHPGGMINNIYLFCSFSEFSFTGTDDSQDSRERKGKIFITPYLFHSFTNIQTNIYKFTSKVVTSYIWLHQIIHLWELSTWLNVNFNLFDDLKLDLVTIICHGQPVDLNSPRLSLYDYK